MTKRKAAKSADSDVEPMVIALAEQLGSFLGRAQKKADAWMDNEALREQQTQIRDGAADLLKQVNKSAASVRNSVGSRSTVKKSKAKRATKASKGRSGGVVDAQGKRHRRPPPQELFDPRLGEPMGKQMGQKSLKRRGRG